MNISQTSYSYNLDYNSNAYAGIGEARPAAGGSFLSFLDARAGATDLPSVQSDFFSAASAKTSSMDFSLRLSGSYLELTGSAGASGSLSLSAAAKELSDRLRELDVFKIIFPNSDPNRKAKTLEEVESDFLGDFASFTDAWSKIASSLGLEEGQSFIMGLDGVGGMTVDGGEMAGQVSNLFNNSPVAVARFAVMAARAAIGDAADTLEGFKDDYNSDPFAAIKDHIDGLKERLLGFRVQAGSAEVAYGFMRDFELTLSASASSLAVGAV